MNKAAVALLVLGLLQLTGELMLLAGFDKAGTALKGIGAATTASPAPKVFTAHRGLETFSTQFTIEWDDRNAGRKSLLLTPETYSKLRGPYNRRNVYGAVLSYGPVLKTNPVTRPMFDSVSRFAFCGDAPLIRELGIDPAAIIEPVRVRYDVRPDTASHDWPRVIEVKSE